MTEDRAKKLTFCIEEKNLHFCNKCWSWQDKFDEEDLSGETKKAQ